MNHDASLPQLRSRLTKLVLPLAVASVLAACGGGGGGGNNNPPPAPAVTLGNAQFTAEKIGGLGFRAAGASAGKTNAAGDFQFVAGQPIEFFLGDNTNALVVGSATLGAAPGAAPGAKIKFGLQGLKEVQNDQDQYLGNLLVLLAALDADKDPTNGITINDAANAAVVKAVTGGKTVSFNQSAATFRADPVIAAIANELKVQLGDAKVALIDFTELFPQSRSSSIAMTSDDKRVVVVNRQKASASIFRVRADNGSDVNEAPLEVPVGKEPRYVAITPDDKLALVTNTIEGSVSVIDLAAAQPAVVGEPIKVGIEPRGIAITPNGAFAFVANFTVGEVTVIRLSNRQVVGTVKTGGNPHAIAITNDGDTNDLDERVYVTRLFGEVIDAAVPDGFDTAKQGVIDTFSVGAAVNGAAQVSQVTLAPFDSGFKADRRQFCQDSRDDIEGDELTPNVPLIFFNSTANGDTGPNVAPNGNDRLANATFCPPGAADLASVPQSVYPNMLNAALIRGRSLYVPNIGASPEPPVKFNVNVQGLVGVVDRTKSEPGAEDLARSLNLNAQVAKEATPPDPKHSLDKLFLNDLVAMDADRGGRNFLFVSRGGNYVLRASLDPATFKLNILTPDPAKSTGVKAVRLQTGNMPTGVVMSSDGKRAYVNNELNMSMSALNLDNNTVLARDMAASEPPKIDSQEHRNLVGKLVFFTALGVPDVMDNDGNGVFDVALRDINPLEHRGKASDNAWSSCASCHEDGHSDNVTWIFETGPRQTIALEGMFTHKGTTQERLLDQRALNWSAVRGSNTDFNQNSIGIQGGIGFATETKTGNRSRFVFNHGPIFGISDSLDALQEWVTTVRAPIVPKLASETAGRKVFDDNCAACHGGAKWTKSRTTPLFARDKAAESELLATFRINPLGVNFFDDGGVKPFDAQAVAGEPGLEVSGPQLVSVVRGANKDKLTLLDDVGTFDKAAPLEIRGAAAIGGAGATAQGRIPGVQSTQGFGAFGAAGFNSPSLLGLSISAPYLHDGSATTLEAVAEKHTLTKGAVKASIKNTLTPQELKDVLDFIRTIDDNTAPAATPSATDAFLAAHPTP